MRLSGNSLATMSLGVSIQLFGITHHFSDFEEPRSSVQACYLHTHVADVQYWMTRVFTS
jgi:hypothetical protein